MSSISLLHHISLEFCMIACEIQVVNTHPSIHPTHQNWLYMSSDAVSKFLLPKAMVLCSH